MVVFTAMQHDFDRTTALPIPCRLLVSVVVVLCVVNVLDAVVP